MVELVSEPADEKVTDDQDGDAQQAVVVQKQGEDVGVAHRLACAIELDDLRSALDQEAPGRASQRERGIAIDRPRLDTSVVERDAGAREELSRVRAAGSAAAVVENRAHRLPRAGLSRMVASM